MKTPFAQLIGCSKKNELVSLCKSAVIADSDFLGFIVACDLGLTHLRYTRHIFDYVPPELAVRPNDREILHADPTSIEGQKAARRFFQSHGQRKYKVGHMFFSKEITNPIREWHFVFYETKELKSKNNHWTVGAHVHITNYLWPNLKCQDVWDDFLTKMEFPKTKEHLAFVRD